MDVAELRAAAVQAEDDAVHLALWDACTDIDDADADAKARRLEAVLVPGVDLNWVHPTYQRRVLIPILIIFPPH